MKNPRFLETIYQVCGRETAVWSSPDWEKVDGLALQGAVISLLDGRVTGGLLDMLRGLGIENVYSTNNPQINFDGWNSISVMVPHTQVGGIMMKTVVLHRH